jgi:GMP synthase (glutamine-hydrolysing)
MRDSVLILRHMRHEPGGTLETAIRDAGLDYEYVDLFQHTPERLPLADAAGLVVLGGAMNVDETDRYPFLAADLRWIERALEIGLPTLGICLGAQLLAKVLGSRVYPNRVKEIGWYEIELTPEAAADPLWAQSGPRTVFQWHGDTFDLPAGTTLLARGDLCENQAFRYGTSAYGVQFHIEMTAGMIEEWLTEPGNTAELAKADGIDPAQIRALTPTELPRLQALAADVLGRFGGMCRKSKRRHS